MAFLFGSFVLVVVVAPDWIRIYAVDLVNFEMDTVLFLIGRGITFIKISNSKSE
jgi:hypothetical protein